MGTTLLGGCGNLGSLVVETCALAHSVIAGQPSLPICFRMPAGRQGPFLASFRKSVARRLGARYRGLGGVLFKPPLS